MSSNPPINCKLLLIGNSSVGKSSLLMRFSDEQWLPEDEASATIGVDFRASCVPLYFISSKLNKGFPGTQDGREGKESQTQHLGA
jgi:GTPase SAR1 family protein